MPPSGPDFSRVLYRPGTPDALLAAQRRATETSDATARREEEARRLVARVVDADAGAAARALSAKVLGAVDAVSAMGNAVPSEHNLAPVTPATQKLAEAVVRNRRAFEQPETSPVVYLHERRQTEAFEAMARVPGALEVVSGLLEEMVQRDRESAEREARAEERAEAAEARERAAEERADRGERRERITLTLATAAVVLTVPSAGPTLARWIGAAVGVIS